MSKAIFQSNIFPRMKAKAAHPTSFKCQLHLFPPIWTWKNKYQVKKTETLQISNWDFFWFRIKGWINHKIVLTNFFLNSLEIVGGEKRQWVLFWGEMAGCGWGLGSKLVGGAVRAHENLTRIQNKVGETPNMRHLIPWGPRLSRATEDSHLSPSTLV